MTRDVCRFDPPSLLSEDKEARGLGRGAFGDVDLRAPARGTVVDYDPALRSYTVQAIPAAASPMPGVGRVLQDPHDSSVLARGTEVLIEFGLVPGIPMITGVCVLPLASSDEVGMQRVSEVPGVGAQDPVYSQTSGAGPRSRGDEVAEDAMGGDYLRSGPDGETIGLLRGGVGLLKGSALAQVRCIGPKDTVEVIAGRYRVVTSAGELRAGNDGGKPNISLRAGANQTTETGADEENWTIHLDVGSVGDLVRLQVTTPGGQTLTDLHVSADGKLTVLAAGGIDLISGGDEPLTVQVEGDEVRAVRGAKTCDVSKDSSSTVGGNRACLTQGDHTEVVAGTHRSQAKTEERVVDEASRSTHGGAVYSKLKASAALVAVRKVVAQLQGGADLVGDLRLAGSLEVGCGGSAVDDDAGSTLTATLTPASDAACLYNALEQLMQALFTAIDTHTHPCSGVLASAPTAPPSIAAKQLLSRVKSSKLKLGG